MYGGISNDPVRGFTNIHTRYPGLIYLQERMRQASTGKAAYNIYLGKHGVGGDKKILKKNEAAPLPEPHNVFHFGLAPSTWMKKQICPMLFDGVLIQFLIILLDVLPSVTKVKLETSECCTLYGCLIFDQKGISPGAEVYDGLIHGIIPSLKVEDVVNLCEDGYPAMLKKLIKMFSEKRLKWVKQIEVFMIQLLDLYVAVPIASYDLEETGESEDVQRRVEEVLLYANTCRNCLKLCMSTGNPPQCRTFCHDCFQAKAVCEAHMDIYDSWNPDKRPCEKCASLNIKCDRFKVFFTISDMDPSYEKYGKLVSKSFSDFLNERSSGTYHFHDIGHNIKNAEASLERGSHYNGKHTYDSSDVAIILSSAEGEDYQILNAGLSHRAVLQFDKQSDELSLQRMSSNLTEMLSKSKDIVKTDVPEQRRPWFTEGHEYIDKPLFVTISQCGLVFATDDHRQDVFFYRQSGLPRKVNFVGKYASQSNDEEERDCLLDIDGDVASTLWKSVGGITFFREDECVLVSDLSYQTIRVLRCIKMTRSKDANRTTKHIPITTLRRLPNSKISIHAFKCENQLDMVPLGLCETHSKLLAVTDPMNRVINLLDVANDLRSSICLKTIKVFPDLPSKLFDCVSINGDLVAVTDVSKESSSLHIVSIAKEGAIHSMEKSIFPTGIYEICLETSSH